MSTSRRVSVQGDVGGRSWVGAGEVAVATSGVACYTRLDQSRGANLEGRGGFLPDPIVLFAHRDVADGSGTAGIVVKSLD